MLLVHRACIIINFNILQTCSLLIKHSGHSCDKLHDISTNSERDINTSPDVIIDFIKPKDAGENCLSAEYNSTYFYWFPFY